MQRLALAAVATCAHAAGLPAAAAAAAPEAPAVFGPPFAFPPLDTLRVTGGYAETRGNHFHAGFDFSTGRRVGMAVRAPLAGRVERVRASGSGYGRSLYLRADDGRLLVFGHLDAFAPALAAHVDSAQRAEGRYEQDLWPAPGRFRFAAGETLAWSGESGAGPPHLHLEVRRGDFALHPLRSGFVPGPVGRPRLESLVLEPLDAAARVAGGIGPRPVAPGDTVEAEGRLRAVVRSASGVPGAGDAPAWSTGIAWGGETVEARLDSISWAGEMSEVDQLVDRGRVTGRGGLVLWSPAGFRPRFLRASAPPEREAGAIVVNRGDPPRALRVWASEPGGPAIERTVVLRPPAGTGPPRVRARPPGGAKARSAPSWSYAVLPGPRLRVRVSGVPAGLSDVRIGRAAGAAGEPAHWDGRGWTAIVDGGGLPDSGGLALRARRADGAAWSSVAGEALWPAGSAQPLRPGPGMALEIGPGEVFEPGIVLTRVRPGEGARSQGLAAAGARLSVRPHDLPLRRPLRVTLPAPGDPAGLGVYRRRGGSWDWMGARLAAGGISAESGQPGEFAVLRDTLAPAVRLPEPSRSGGGPYSRWQLTAAVTERGSGIDAHESAFVVDGVRVPTEWDAEARVLRWRPLARPAGGRHEVEVRAVDRAGNVASRRGSFVLDSGGH